MRNYGLLTLFVFLVFNVQLQAQPIAIENIINYEKIQYFNYEKEGFGAVSSNKAKEARAIELKGCV